MRFYSLILCFFVCHFATAQDLKNTEWVKIKAERKDGSTVVDRHGPDTLATSYFFTGDSVHVALDNQYDYAKYYSVENNILSIGHSLQYHIDSFSDAFLYLSPYPTNDLPDDKLTCYTYINADYLFDYLKKGNKLTILGDTLVVCNNEFSPTYNGNFLNKFSSEFTYSFGSKTISGTFVITPDADIKEIHVDSNKQFTDKEISKIIKVINASKKSWVLPPTPSPLQFKITFWLSFSQNGTLHGTNLVFFGVRTHYGPTTQQLEIADRHFNNGLKFSTKEKFDNAIDEFKQCIAIDATNTDAYYDLAYAYQKTGNKDMACDTWRKLSEMGQKNGRDLLTEYCK